MDGLTVELLGVFLCVNAVELFLEGFVGKQPFGVAHGRSKRQTFDGANRFAEPERAIVKAVKSEILIDLVVVEVEVFGVAGSVEDSAEFVGGNFFQVAHLDAAEAEFVVVGEEIIEEVTQLDGSEFFEAVDGNQHLQGVLSGAVNQNLDAFAVNAFAQSRAQFAELIAPRTPRLNRIAAIVFHRAIYLCLIKKHETILRFSRYSIFKDNGDRIATPHRLKISSFPFFGR